MPRTSRFARGQTVDAEHIRAYVGAEPTGPLPAYAWPGGYPLSYLTAGGDELCADCAKNDLADPDHYDPPVAVTAYGANCDYPETDTRCDNCNVMICDGTDRELNRAVNPKHPNA